MFKKMVMFLSSLVFVQTVLSQTVNVKTLEELQTAIHSAKPGIEIVLAPGAYIGEVYIPIKASGEDDKPVKIKAAEIWKSEIYAGGGYGDGIRLGVGVKNVVIEGIAIYGARYCGIRFQQCERITILDCRIEMCRAQGLLGSGSGHTICGNLLQRNGITKWDHGLYLSGEKHVIFGNVARGNFGWGIHLYPEIKSSIVVGNVAYDNKFVGILIWAGGENVAWDNYSWGNGRSNYQWQNPDVTNRIFGNFETDPMRWPLKAKTEPTGGWTAPTAVINVWE